MHPSGSAHPRYQPTMGRTVRGHFQRQFVTGCNLAAGNSCRQIQFYLQGAGEAVNRAWCSQTARPELRFPGRGTNLPWTAKGWNQCHSKPFLLPGSRPGRVGTTELADLLPQVANSTCGSRLNSHGSLPPSTVRSAAFRAKRTRIATTTTTATSRL